MTKDLKNGTLIIYSIVVLLYLLTFHENDLDFFKVLHPRVGLCFIKFLWYGLKMSTFLFRVKSGKMSIIGKENDKQSVTNIF